MKTPNRVYVALLILAITNVIGGLLYASQDLTSSIVVISIALLIGLSTTIFRIDPTTSTTSIMLYLIVSNCLMLSSIYFVHTIPIFKELLLRSPFMYAATKLKKSEIEKDL